MKVKYIKKFRLRKFYQSIKILVRKTIFKKPSKMACCQRLQVQTVIFPALWIHINVHFITKSFRMTSILAVYKEKELLEFFYLFICFN